MCNCCLDNRLWKEEQWEGEAILDIGTAQSGSNTVSEKWLDSRYSVKIQFTKSAERLDMSVKETYKGDTKIFVFRNREND